MSLDPEQLQEKADRQQRYRARGFEWARQLGLEDEAELLKLCADETQETSARGIACLALGCSLYQPAVPTLLKLASHPDDGLVVDATRALQMIASSDMLQPMLTLVRKCPRPIVRERAVDVLGSLHDPQAEEVLISILADRSEAETVRGAAAEALVGMSEYSGRAIPCLVDALQDASAILRWDILNTLGVKCDRSVLPVIESYLSDEEIVSCLPDRPTIASAAQNALRNLQACMECAA